MFDYIRELLARSAGGSFELIAICVFLGLIVAGFIALYDKRMMGNYVRALIARGATSPESALTLEEAGYSKNFAVKSALRRKSVFSGTVYEASEDVRFDSDSHALPIFRRTYDAKTARFYVPEQVKYRAEVRFEKKGSHVMAIVLGGILLLFVLLAAFLLKDKVVRLVQQFFEAMSSK